MAYWLVRCPRCGRPWISCNCGKRNEELKDYENKFDVSFQCYTCECFQEKPKHGHTNRSLLLTRNWEDIAALWCENLITLGKYKKACEDKNLNIIKNSTMHDYIMTRLENIDGFYSCLFLNGKLNSFQYQYFEFLQDDMVKKLDSSFDGHIEDEIPGIGPWSSAKLFDNYIKKTLESEFFKQNDIKIENQTF